MTTTEELYVPTIQIDKQGRKSLPTDPEKVKELTQYSIMVGMPCYGGTLHMQTMLSLMNLQGVCQQLGISLTYQFLAKESLITRARNQVADAFRRSTCTHLLFIDSDVQFDHVDVLMMLYIQHMRKDIKVICGPYPKKHISWEKVKQAVDAGLADANPNRLEDFVGEFVFNPKPSDDAEQKTVDVNFGQLIEVLESGTGFMMIEKSVFDDFEKAYPEQMYLPDHFRLKDFDGSREVCAFFDTVICPETKRYLSEDYMFCQWLRKIGHKIYLMPWAATTHIGVYEFKGDMLQLVMNGINPLVDTAKVVKT